MSATADPRALAAQALAGVVGGQSLRAASAETSAKLHDPRDRALLSALLHEGARWWLRFDVALDAMLESPLRERDADIRALVVLGLVQLETMELSDYAAVAATVEATRALRKPSFAGLVNALLRRWLREREAQTAKLDRHVETRTAHPRWLIDKLQFDWAEQVESILAANNAPAPLWLRVNRRRVTRADFAAQLHAAGIGCQMPQAAPDALILDASRDVTALPGYAQGFFSVQDGAAQQAAILLDLKAGQRVLDACAAPGGKSAHVLETADVKLTALDADTRRLPRLRENLARLGLTADVRTGDAAVPRDWWDGKPFDRILLDAPCSATGIIRRQPDVKLHRRVDDIPALVATQKRLLDALWPLLARGGRLVYATCSVFVDENARQIGAFAQRHADARAVAAPLTWHAAGAGMQNLPGESGMDGFFYALVDKHN